MDNDIVVGCGVGIQTNCYLTAGCVIEDEVLIGAGVTKEEPQHDGSGQQPQ